MIGAKTIEILEYRIQQEEYSSRLYEQIALILDNKGYLNTAKLFEKYSTEELNHAGWAKSFLLDYGVAPTLKPLPSTEVEITCCKDAFQAAMDHELLVTKQCEELADFAMSSKAHVLYTLALKYCAEQQEEIGKIQTLLDVCNLSDNCLLTDQYIGLNLL
jgi:ferritin